MMRYYAADYANYRILRKRFGYRRLHILLVHGATHCGAFQRSANAGHLILSVITARR